jgi:hypothetical protein
MLHPPGVLTPKRRPLGTVKRTLVSRRHTLNSAPTTQET